MDVQAPVPVPQPEAMVPSAGNSNAPDDAFAGPFDDASAMQLAIDVAGQSRLWTAPNPWVGAVLLDSERRVIATGRTQPPGGAHAEAMALRETGDRAKGATLVVTLEPCSHHGRTPPCADAVIEAGIARVVVAVRDPDVKVAGQGIQRLRDAGIDVIEGVGASLVEEQLKPYLHQRRTGRPFVVVKLAMTLDGRIAAPDGTSTWITGEEARRDVHQLRAECDAILVGAGTVRADDPSLTVRMVEGRDPTRYVLTHGNHVDKAAKAQPCIELQGELHEVLDDLGRRGHLQLLVEGGATVAGAFHQAGLVDQYYVYIAPAFLGGDDGRPLFAGPGASTMADLWRGSFRSVTQLGADIRVILDRASR
jgi:diaminohydroxyphosphoribosylaminopyrimidine deaminase / 5-amino-6-(5-phosphoribosylamino)uracil reductase